MLGNDPPEADMIVRLFAVLVAMSVTVSAADLRVLSVGAIQPALGTIAEQFKRETGNNVTIQVDTSPGITRRLASGEAADILIATPDLVESAAKEDKLISTSKMTVARVGIGIAMRRGAAPPNIKTGDALMQALLSANMVVYNEGSSGLYLEKLFD